MYYRKYIKTSFLISNMQCKELHLDNYKRQFSQYSDFFAPSDSRISNSCISAKNCPNKPYINGKLIYLAFMGSINRNCKKLTLKTVSLVHGHIYFRDILLIIISSCVNNCGQCVFEKNIYFMMRFVLHQWKVRFLLFKKNKRSKGLTMKIYFQSLIWLFLPKVSKILTTTNFLLSVEQNKCWRMS